jgi:hypothetical protein
MGEGHKPLIVALDSGFVGSDLLLVEVRSLLFALMYLLLRRLVRLLANSSNDLNREVEVVVLRHQQMVLKRHMGRPRLRLATGCSWPR